MRSASGTTGSDREPADTGELAVQMRSEQRFPDTIEACRTGHPICRNPLDKGIALNARLRPQGIEVRGQPVDHTMKRRHPTAVPIFLPLRLSRYAVDAAPGYRVRICRIDRTDEGVL
jgi:hypothetical protein